MELVLELFLTASLALILSFLVAKLVSLAIAGDAERELEVDLGILGDKLAVQSFESEKTIEFVGQSAETIEKFVGEPSEISQTVETACFHCEIQKKQCEFVQVSSPSGSGDYFEDDVLQKNASEGSDMSGTLVENSGNLNIEEANVDDTVNQRIDEVIGEKTTNNVFPCAIIEADNEEDDDDWEGIERTELENIFTAASRFVGEQNGLSNAGSELEMEFYGLHKVATEGPCREPQPMALKLSARAKWNAWQRLGNMSPEVAMEQYVSLLSDKAPGWIEHYSAGWGEGKYLQHQPDSIDIREFEELTSAGNIGNAPTDYDLTNKAK